MKFDVIGIGMSTVDNLFIVPKAPEFGQKCRAVDYSRQGGGPVATAMVALARLGAKVSFIGKTGDDPDGDFIRDELLKEGVDVSHFITASGAKSRVVLVLVDQYSGDRCFIPRVETCSPLKIDELDKDFITSARILHLDDADEASIAAAKWAKEAGIRVVYDGSWYTKSACELLKLTDVAIVSKMFANEMAPGTPFTEVTQRLFAVGAKIGIVTLGEKGCVVTHSAETFQYPAYHQIDVVDTTGAGDVFHGAFIYGMLQDWEVKKMVAFASAAAALNCLKLGGRAGIPNLKEVIDFLS
ncbi:MAG: carbohydrate kinase family protein [Candidatus Poribacteria bacterium]